MLFVQDTAANPEGAILENVPATIVAPVPGPPDFNGASAGLSLSLSLSLSLARSLARSLSLARSFCMYCV